jgi:hypothetical protein
MDGNGYPVADIWKEVNPLISIAFGNCILRFRRSISKMPKCIASYLEFFYPIFVNKITTSLAVMTNSIINPLNSI